MEEDQVKNLPQGVAISWGLVKEPQRGPKREMNVQKIVEAAVAIADQDGITAVSMNRVATSLGFTAMSLYRYIQSKDDLLVLMQEQVSQVDFPAKYDLNDWRGNMKFFVLRTAKVYSDHPWFGDIPISGVPITPNNLKVVDWLLGIMRTLSISELEKMGIVLLLSSYARAIGLLQRDMERAMKSGMTPEAFSGIDYNAALQQLVRPEQFPYLYPLIQSGSYTGENQEPGDEMDDLNFGLERILDGIEQYLR